MILQINEAIEKLEDAINILEVLVDPNDEHDIFKGFHIKDIQSCADYLRHEIAYVEIDEMINC